MGKKKTPRRLYTVDGQTVQQEHESDYRKKGKVIAVEGIDGAGKSTLCHSLKEYIETVHKREVVLTSAISDWCTPLGEDLGKIMRSPSHLLGEDMHPHVEIALMLAARADNWHRIIKPALERNAVVVSDRFRTSMFVYQRGTDGKRIARAIASQRLREFGLGKKADLEILLDIDTEKAMRHHEFSNNRLERRPQKEWEEMRQCFLKEAEWHHNARIINAANSKDRVFADAADAVQDLLEPSDVEREPAVEDDE